MTNCELQYHNLEYCLVCELFIVIKWFLFCNFPVIFFHGGYVKFGFWVGYGLETAVGYGFRTVIDVIYAAVAAEAAEAAHATEAAEAANADEKKLSWIGNLCRRRQKKLFRIRGRCLRRQVRWRHQKQLFRMRNRHRRQKKTVSDLDLEPPPTPTKQTVFPCHYCEVILQNIAQNKIDPKEIELPMKAFVAIEHRINYFLDLCPNMMIEE